MRTLAGLDVSSRSIYLIERPSTARLPVQARNMTYVLSLMLEQAFSISMISSFDNASLFRRTDLGNLTFNTNFLGLMSVSQYSSRFFAVTTLSFSVMRDIYVILHKNAIVT
jgi:hypothetical protein